MDATAKRYGTLPSRLLGIENEFQALTIDVLTAKAGYEAEAAALKKRR